MKLPPDELALYQGIDEILWKDWDPIGVSRLEDWPRDEYRGYAPTVFQLARRGAQASEIANLLRQIVSDRMGFDPSQESELPIAEKIRALKLSLMPEADEV